MLAPMLCAFQSCPLAPGLSHAACSPPRLSPPAARLSASRADFLSLSAAAWLSVATPAFARELTPNEQREALQAVIDKRGGLDPAVEVVSSQVMAKLAEQELPFSPVQRRYTGYQKFAPRIQEGIEAYTGSLRTAIVNGDWESVLAGTEKGSRGKGDAVKGVSPSPTRSVARAYGLFANTALQSENDSTTTANLLARHLINEYYFSLDDIAAAAAAKDSEGAKVAWRVGKEYVNAYLALVNKVSKNAVCFHGSRLLPGPLKFGDKFPLIETSM
ncbi:MAG: hypothetical protein SGPRY_011243 [Prymnesium sp.]